MERVTYSGLAHLRIYHKYTEGAWLMRHPGRSKMEWITDEFPPIAEGLKNVSIEVEAHLESGKIIPAIYARSDKNWHLAEGKYPRIQEAVIGWRRKTC